MNKHIFHGKWHEMKGRMKQGWGSFKGNELVRIKGNGEEIYGILQKHYGYTKVEVRKCIKNFIRSASVQHFRALAQRSKTLISKSIQEHPYKAVTAALLAGVLMGNLSNR